MGRRLPPAPPAPPSGFMWYYWKLVPIETVERHARTKMGNHDRLPRAKRDRNDGRHPHRPGPAIWQRGTVMTAEAGRTSRRLPRSFVDATRRHPLPGPARRRR